MVRFTINIIAGLAPLSVSLLLSSISQRVKSRPWTDSAQMTSHVNGDDDQASYRVVRQPHEVSRYGTPPGTETAPRDVQAMTDWVSLVLAMRSTSTGMKSRIGLPANRSWEACTVRCTPPGARSGNDPTSRRTTSLTALVSSSGDSILRMLPSLGGGCKIPSKYYSTH